MKTIRFKWAVLVALCLVCTAGCITLDGIRTTLDPEMQKRHQEISERLIEAGKEIKEIRDKVKAGEIPTAQGLALIKSLSAEAKALIAEQNAMPKGNKILLWISIIGNIALTVIGGERAMAVKKAIGVVGRVMRAVEKHSSKGDPAREIKATLGAQNNDALNDLASKLFPASSNDPKVVSIGPEEAATP